MNKIYQVYQVSDSTGETLDRIFLALKAQFSNFECKTIHYSFTRTKNQIDKIIANSKIEKNIIVLYTIVDKGLANALEMLIPYGSGAALVARRMRYLSTLKKG